MLAGGGSSSARPCGVQWIARARSLLPLRNGLRKLNRFYEFIVTTTISFRNLTTMASLYARLRPKLEFLQIFINETSVILVRIHRCNARQVTLKEHPRERWRGDGKILIVTGREYDCIAYVVFGLLGPKIAQVWSALGNFDCYLTSLGPNATLHRTSWQGTDLKSIPRP